MDGHQNQNLDRFSEQTFLLLKLARPNTGEHWAERVACAVGNVLGIPVAKVELALWDGKGATVSEEFKKKGQALIHGNELLHETDADYPLDVGKRRAITRAHTIEAIQDVLTNNAVMPPDTEEGSEFSAFG